MQTLTQPTLLSKPFAESGEKNTIPVTNTDASNPQLADLTNGFPAITSLDPDDGGLPPERKDFNGLGYLTTTYDYFYQAGGTFTFDQTTAVGIGGYPLGARLWFTDSNGDTNILRSTIQENYDDFINNKTYDVANEQWIDKSGIIGTTWVKDTPTESEVDAKIATADALCVHKAGSETITGSKTFSGPVFLGNSASSTTPSSATDNTTKVATTAWVNNFKNAPTTKASLDNNIMPDYNAGYLFSSGSTTTANGWLKIRYKESENAIVRAGNLVIFDHTWNGGDYGRQEQCSWIPIPKGYVVTYTNLVSAIFWPCIGG
ncbi:MAG: hypothetical protein J6T10_30335 [Methanobrevibacter sp.]|nr:hypothetical protein [Methanobrevibacter sp.]